MTTWRLAQLNIGRLRAPTDEGNATAIRAFPGDDLMILNLSVWESVETLADYVYRSAHTPFLRRRGEWFERLGDTYLVLWWIPAGAPPTIDEALARLEHLKSTGPSPEAFTFRQPFPHPGGPTVPADERNSCPA